MFIGTYVGLCSSTTYNLIMKFPIIMVILIDIFNNLSSLKITLSPITIIKTKRNRIYLLRNIVKQTQIQNN